MDHHVVFSDAISVSCSIQVFEWILDYKWKWIVSQCKLIVYEKINNTSFQGLAFENVRKNPCYNKIVCDSYKIYSHDP